MSNKTKYIHNIRVYSVRKSNNFVYKNILNLDKTTDNALYRQRESHRIIDEGALQPTLYLAHMGLGLCDCSIHEKAMLKTPLPNTRNLQWNQYNRNV